MPPQTKLPPGAEIVDDSTAIKLPPGAELVSDDIDKANLPPGTMSASPKVGTPAWFKARSYDLAHGALHLLPVAGSVVGGLIGGAAGIESGPGALATAAGGAAAGGAAGEGARQGLETAIFKSPDVPTTTKGKLKEVGKQAAMGGLSEFGGRLVAKPLEKAAQYFADTAATSEKAGVKLLPSEAHGKAPSFAEKLAKGHVLTSGKMERFRAIQNEQTKSAVEKIANDISRSHGTSEEFGKVIQTGIKAHTEEFRKLQKQMYDDIATKVNERVQMVPVTYQVRTGVKDAVTGKPIMKTMRKIEAQVIDDVMPSTVALKKFAAQELQKLTQAEKILDPSLLSQSRGMLQTILKAPDNMPYSAIASARSDALAKARELDQALAGKEAGLAKKMAELFDTSMIDAAKKSKIPGLAEDIRAANEFTANEHRMFEQALVKKVVESKKPEAIATLIRGKAIGNEETRDLFTIMPKELHPFVQRQILLDTMRQSTNNVSKVFNERKFAEAIGSIGDERGEIIFGNNWKNVKELTGLLEKINGPTGLGGGSGAALQNISVVRGILEAAYLLPIGLATTGHIESGAISLAGEVVGFRTMANLLTHPGLTAKLVNALRVGVRTLPYAGMATINESGGVSKSAKKLKELKEQMDKQKPTPVTAPGPQSTAAPQINYIYNDSTESLEPVPVP